MVESFLNELLPVPINSGTGSKISVKVRKAMLLIHGHCSHPG
jgi:hypothetical protein